MNSKYTGKSAKVYSELVRKKKRENSIENSKKRIHKVTKRKVVADISQIDSSSILLENQNFKTKNEIRHSRL